MHYAYIPHHIPDGTKLYTVQTAAFGSAGGVGLLGDADEWLRERLRVALWPPQTVRDLGVGETVFPPEVFA